MYIRIALNTFIWRRVLCKVLLQRLFLYNDSKPHPEKCFLESSKIWLVQQNISFKYGSMEFLFELTKRILFNFFALPTKIFCIDSKKHGIAN